MPNLPETNSWDPGVYQLEVADPVQGGANGVSNSQAKALANRTSWLKALLAGGTFTAGDLLYAAGASLLARLGIGAAGTFLRSSGAVPAWVDNPAPRTAHYPLVFGAYVTTSTVFVLAAGGSMTSFDRSRFPTGTTFALSATFDGVDTIEIQLYDYGNGFARSGIISIPSGNRQSTVALTDLIIGDALYQVRFRSVGGASVTLLGARIVATLPA